MKINETRKILESGGIALGCSASQLRSAETPRMFAASGLDWIFIDTEHGPFTSETVQDMVRTSLLAGITPVVRVPDLQYDLAARALDMGAEGIIFPRIESREVLEKAVSWTKFPPKGVRGFGLTGPMAGYVNASFDEITSHANRQTLVVFQIESVTAVERADELVSVEGVDAVMIGPADLSTSLGIAGQFDHPKLAEAISKVIAACERHGKWPSIQCRTPAIAKTWMERGMKLIGCGNDQMLLWNGVSAMTKELIAARG